MCSNSKHRRRIKTEEKDKVVASVCGGQNLFHASCFSMDNLKKRMNCTRMIRKKRIQFNSKKLYLVIMTMLHGYMQTYSSLFSDTKKNHNHYRKNRRKKQKTTTFTQIGSNITWEILSLCGLNPPPHPVHLRPPAFIQHIHTYGYTNIPKFFLPNKRHMRKQTLTKLVLSGLYRPKLWRKIIQLLLQKTCSWMLLPLSSSLSTPQSLYK